MLTIDSRHCPFGCTYCFDRFSQYERVPNISTVEASPESLREIDIIYPACDVDLFARKDACDVLTRCADLGRSISVSTKAELTPAMLDVIEFTAETLRSRGDVLKIGISISTKHRIADIEPRTADYAARLMNLAALAAINVPRALVLRPLLSEIDNAEYESIIEDCAQYTDAVLLGGEWLDAESSAVGQGQDVQWRSVNWLDGGPSWPARDDAERQRILEKRAHALGLRTVDSDLELMRLLMDGTLT